MNNPAPADSGQSSTEKLPPSWSLGCFLISIVLALSAAVPFLLLTVFDEPTVTETDLINRVSSSAGKVEGDFYALSPDELSSLLAFRLRARRISRVNYYKEEFEDLLKVSEAVVRRQIGGFRDLAETDLKLLDKRKIELLRKFDEHFGSVPKDEPFLSEIESTRRLISDKVPFLSMRLLVLEADELLTKDGYLKHGTVEIEKKELERFAAEVEKKISDERFEREAKDILSAVEKRLKGLDAVGPEPTNVKAAVEGFLWSQGLTGDLSTLGEPYLAAHRNRPVWRVSLRFRLVGFDDIYDPFRTGRITNFYFVNGRIIGWDGV